jgi:hypothetical protein
MSATRSSGGVWSLRILTAIQVILILGIACMVYLARKFMGVARWFANQNRLIEDTTWANLICPIVAVVAACLLIWAAYQLIKRRRRLRPLLLTIALALITCAMAIFTDTAVSRAYYYVVFALMLVTLIQVGKAACSTPSS